MKLTEFLKSHGYTFAPRLDGEVQRFQTGGSSQSGWFVGRRFRLGDKEVVRAKVGDFRDGSIHYYQSTNDSLTASECEELERQAAEIEAKAREVERESSRLAALKAEKIWSMSEAAGTAPYCTKKGLSGLHGGRISTYEKSPGALIIPVRDVGTGALTSLQFIQPDGSKRFLPGGRKRGCTHKIGESNEGPIGIAEGYATAASIHEATGWEVHCAFDAGNLGHVAETLRDQGAGRPIILFGDDDRWTDGNPGRNKALQAARQGQGMALFPDFPPDCLASGARPTDWNDLHALLGIEEVRRQVESGYTYKRETPGAQLELNEEPASEPPSSHEVHKISRGQDCTSGFWGIEGEKLPIVKTARGKAMPPLQQDLVDAILHRAGDTLLKYERDIFHYTGTHWEVFTLADHDALKCEIARLASGLGDSRYVASCYNLLMWHLPGPPHGHNMFRPNPWVTNFKNGTLHAMGKAGEKRRLVFLPHAKTDYLINVLPLEYREGDTTQNPEFNAFLDRTFEGDPHKEERIRYIRRMFGMCLMPAIPRLFILHGASNTGKSTVIKLAIRLVDESNTCTVAPNHFHGFNMEGMAGKLVNFDTDIPATPPIKDDVVKKIRDRLPMRIRRKGLKDVMAPFPAIHMFGANKLPQIEDSESKAHSQRWTLIRFDRVLQGPGMDDYDKFCFDVEPRGILNFALQGLREVLETGGVFEGSGAGVQELEHWQMRGDTLGLFFKALDEGELSDGNSKVTRGENHKIERKQFWEIFKVWHEAEFNFAPNLGRTTFFDMVRSRKIEERKTNGVLYFMGIGAGAGDRAEF